MNDTVVAIAILIYDFLLVAGTAFLVVEYQWSMWTFFLTLCFFITTKVTKDQK